MYGQIGGGNSESDVIPFARVEKNTTDDSVAVAAHRSSRGGYRPAEEIELQFRCRRDGAIARPGPLFADKR